MNKAIIRCVAMGWLGMMAWANGGQAVLSGEPESTPQITVYVYNWAGIEPNTLREAKGVVARIFRQAGVEATLLDAPSPEEESAAPPRLGPFNFFVQILSLPMAKTYGLPTQILGIAPGDPQELNRDQVYVLDPVAERMAQEQLAARENRSVFINANKGQILGHGMVHEIGHVLLRQASHAPAGLMRARWDRNDFEDMVAGDLVFTPGEAERIRAEVLRRNARGNVLPGSKE